jgi:hypothetical protein
MEPHFRMILLGQQPSVGFDESVILIDLPSAQNWQKLALS